MARDKSDGIGRCKERRDGAKTFNRERRQKQTRSKQSRHRYGNSARAQWRDVLFERERGKRKGWQSADMTLHMLDTHISLALASLSLFFSACVLRPTFCSRQSP